MGFHYRSKKLLDGATSSGRSSDSLDVQNFAYGAVFYDASSVTNGATLDVEAKRPDGTWHPIDSRDITSSGKQTVVLLDLRHYDEVTLNISSYTDGTYNGWIKAGFAHGSYGVS